MSYPLEVPAYVIDNRLVKAIIRKNLPYIRSKYEQDRCLFDRLFFWELPRVAAAKSSRRIYVFPLLGFAIIHRAYKLIAFMLEEEADVHRKGMILNETLHDKDFSSVKQIEEVSCLTLVSQLFNEMDSLSDVLRTFECFKLAGVDVFSSFELVRQTTLDCKVMHHEITVFDDIWRYLDQSLTLHGMGDVHLKLRVLSLARDMCNGAVTLSEALALANECQTDAEVAKKDRADEKGAGSKAKGQPEGKNEGAQPKRESRKQHGGDTSEQSAAATASVGTEAQALSRTSDRQGTKKSRPAAEKPVKEWPKAVQRASKERKESTAAKLAKQAEVVPAASIENLNGLSGDEQSEHHSLMWDHLN